MEENQRVSRMRTDCPFTEHKVGYGEGRGGSGHTITDGLGVELYDQVGEADNAGCGYAECNWSAEGVGVLGGIFGIGQQKNIALHKAARESGFVVVMALLPAGTIILLETASGTAPVTRRTCSHCCLESTSPN